MTDFESTIYLSLITELPAYNYIFAAATTTHVIPTMYHHTTTTAIVESRVQPVATEHAIPTSTQSHLPLVIGKTNYHNTVTITEYVYIEFISACAYTIVSCMKEHQWVVHFTYLSKEGVYTEFRLPLVHTCMHAWYIYVSYCKF